jgi:hypothetical protein
MNRKGWYPDPADPDRQLFWDGHRWSRESHNLPLTAAEVNAGTSEDRGSSRWEAPLLPSIISVSRAFGRILLRAARRLNRYPLWLKIGASAVALSLIGAAIIGGVLYGGAADQTPPVAKVKSVIDLDDSLRAETVCLADVSDKFWGTPRIDDFRNSPPEGQNTEQWITYMTEGMQPGSIAQADSVLQLFDLISEGVAADGGPKYRENSYVGFGHGYIEMVDGSLTPNLWVCGVVLDRRYPGQEESLVFPLG